MKAILVVSFGTSHRDTREKTIDKIEQDIAEAYKDYKVYRAFTSKMIISIMKKKYNEVVLPVKSAMEQMISDGVKEVVVQPTHVLNGIENDIMKAEILEYTDKFSKISIGDPLLTTHEDSCQLIEAILSEFAFVKSDTAVVLMGHGTTHYANSIYPALDYQFKQMGHKNFFVSTVEGYPEIDVVLNYVKAENFTKVVLAPLMIVAGDHAKNDLAGDEPDSYKSIFLDNGFEVECHLKGLGEYEGIRQLLIKHIIME
ncbi:MAG: sirohydrochlorin cobaltochelatase [Epulopiscium sp. Nuni2H_MBin003]|nr:MAG: sirohydrochlorin cobaltochelatase [Epulopiscium sp. Nuni2H_MBin003]